MELSGRKPHVDDLSRRFGSSTPSRCHFERHFDRQFTQIRLLHGFGFFKLPRHHSGLSELLGLVFRKTEIVDPSRRFGFSKPPNHHFEQPLTQLGFPRLLRRHFERHLTQIRLLRGFGFSRLPRRHFERPLTHIRLLQASKASFRARANPCRHCSWLTCSILGRPMTTIAITHMMRTIRAAAFQQNFGELQPNIIPCIFATASSIHPICFADCVCIYTGQL